MENLYLIKCNEFYKIGIANDLDDRLTNLQVGNPYKLVVADCFEFPNAFVVEQVLHREFAGVRKLGEWFLLTGDDVRKFREECLSLGGVRSVRRPRVRITEGSYLHAAILKVALNKLEEAGLCKRDGMAFDFDPEVWTDVLGLSL